MDVELSETDKDMDKQKRIEENQRTQIQQVVSEVYDRGNSGAPRRGCKRKKNEGEI
jgi:hypothetical protein